MNYRYASSPEAVKSYDTSKLREEFLIENLLEEGMINGTYSMYDRMMVLGVKPTSSSLSMPAFEDFTKADFFLERREMGILNIGGTGTVTVDGEAFQLANKDMLYVGQGKKEVAFASEDTSKPAEFYINSCPAHKEYPTVKGVQADATQVHLGAPETSNERTIFQFIHEDGIQSCQLVMGFTELKKGSIWNTFPPHTHNRRMEAYFYFDLAEDQLVMHFMGQPTETRHIAMRNKEAVISPEWSIHSGAGTAAYCFAWGMAGENKAFTDMDAAPLSTVR